MQQTTSTPIIEIDKNLSQAMKTTLLILMLVVIYLFSWVLQNHLFLNWDVGHLLNSSRLLLAGGNYSEDFFIPSPPAILHLYLLPIVLQKILPLPLILIFKIYIYLLASISLVCSYLFLKKIFINDEMNLIILFSMLAFAFLCIPMYEFGQRDHLLAIFTLPYLLLTARQCEEEKKSLWYIFIGIFAGLGIVIKPQFILLAILIEIYYSYNKKTFFSFCRYETISLILFVGFYHLATIIFYPDYFFIVVPYLLKFYYQVIGQPWLDLLSNRMAIFFYLISGLFLTSRYKHPYQNLCDVLLMALIAFILTYLLQATTFYYHFIPAFTVALLLLALFFIYLIHQRSLTQNQYLLIGLLAWASFIFLLYPVHSYYFIVLVLMMGIFYYYAKKNVSLKSLFFLTLVSTLFVGFPIKLLSHIYWYNKDYKIHVLHKLIKLFKSYPSHQGIMVLSVMTNYNSPLVYYTDNFIAERFDSLWMTSILAKYRLNRGDLATREYIRHNKDPYFFIYLLAKDINKYHPQFIFVDEMHPNVRFYHQGELKRTYFNFVSYFNENKSFKSAFKQYHYVTTINNNDNLYPSQLDIYER